MDQVREVVRSCLKEEREQQKTREAREREKLEKEIASLKVLAQKHEHAAETARQVLVEEKKKSSELTEKLHKMEVDLAVARQAAQKAEANHDRILNVLDRQGSAEK